MPISKKRSDKQVFEIFSGMGGFSQGFEPYFEVVKAVDIDSEACQTYKRNHPEVDVRCADVRDVTYAKKDFSGIVAVVGGSPCDDFSQMNFKADPNSDKSRLLLEYHRAIKEIQPEFFILENVPRVPKKIKDAMKLSFERMGYKVTSRHVLSADLGSVQRRKRWIMTGSKRRHFYPPKVPHHRTAREILIPGEIPEIKMRGETWEKVRSLPPSAVGKWVALPGQKRASYFIIAEDQLMPSIVNPSRSRYIDPERKRLLSLRELCMAQGFPKDYQIPEQTVTAKSRQVAKAVPVEVATAFAREARRKLD